VNHAKFLAVAAETSMNERHGRTHLSSSGQLPLAFESAAGPDPESALRAAYRRLTISRSLSYEQAMSERAYEIGIRNLAEAIARRIRRRRRRRNDQR
jgi:hypothetical protein